MLMFLSACYILVLFIILVKATGEKKEKVFSHFFVGKSKNKTERFHSVLSSSTELFVCYMPAGQYPDVRLAIAGLFLNTDCTIVLGRLCCSITLGNLWPEVNYRTCRLKARGSLHMLPCCAVSQLSYPLFYKREHGFNLNLQHGVLKSASNCKHLFIALLSDF